MPTKTQDEETPPHTQESRFELVAASFLSQFPSRRELISRPFSLLSLVFVLALGSRRDIDGHLVSPQGCWFEKHSHTSILIHIAYSYLYAYKDRDLP